MTVARASLAIFLGLVCAYARSQDRQVGIGVLGLFHPRHIVVASAGGAAVLVACGSENFVVNGEAGHRRAVLELAPDAILLTLGTTTHRCVDVDFAARDGGPAEVFLTIPAKIKRGYRGVMRVSKRRSELLLVVRMDLETAVASIVAAESPPGATIEALKAQAVVSRSFLVSGAKHHDFDFCDTTHCQFLREPPAAESQASEAARLTAAQVLTYQGRPLAAMYSSRCGGHTVTLEDIGLRSAGYPYYAVRCDYCLRHPANWQRTVSGQVAHGLRKSESDRLGIDRVQGWSAIPSNNYSVETRGGGFVVEGRGSGHGVGMCQYGAAGMAQEGATFRDILRHYYPNTEISTLSAH